MNSKDGRKPLQTAVLKALLPTDAEAPKGLDGDKKEGNDKEKDGKAADAEKKEGI